MAQNKVFVPQRALGFVSNHIPLQVRYIKSRKENLIVTCVGKSFHTYGISHFSLLSVSGLHPSDITCLSSDSYHIYTSAGHNIYAWRRGTELKHVYQGHEHNIHLLLPFGIHLISVDEGNNLKMWDIKDESSYLNLKFSEDDFRITAIFHPSTYINKILLGSEQGQLQLWNISTSKLVYTFKGWKCEVTCISQAPAVDVAAIGLKNGKIYIHNLKLDHTILEFTQDWGTVTSITFRWDAEPIMATGSVTGHIVFWDLEKRQVASQILRAHDGPVTGMTCLMSEPLMLTSSPDNTLKLWIFDMPDGGARLLRIREGHSGAPSHIRFHGSNGHNILSAGSDSTLRIFNTRTEQFNKSLGKASYNRKASKKRKGGVDDPLIMPPITQFISETTREKEWDNITALHAGLRIVTTWSYNKLKMGDLKLLPDRFTKKNLKGDIDSVVANCLTMTKCGNFVLVGYSTGHVDRFNVQSGIWRDSYGSPSAHNGPVRGVAVDGLNQIVISGCNNGDVHYYRFKCKGAEPLKIENLEEPISFFRAHQESSMLAVVLEDFSVLIIDLDTKRMIRKFTGHTGQITDVTFSPDSRWLVTSSMDCTIKTWNIPSGQLIDHFKTESPCISLDLSPTGEVLATAHVDYLGMFLWANRTIYMKITLKSLDPSSDAPLAVLPECFREIKDEETSEEYEETDFKSPEQISNELITLSGLSTSRWLNLLNLDVIKTRNKPKAPPKTPKLAPFFLPTIPSLNFQFNLSSNGEASKVLTLSSKNLTNFSEFGKLLFETVVSGDFKKVVDKLKSFGPSLIDFEIKSLAPEGGGSIELMLQFLKCLEFMFSTNKDFELASAYLGVYMKTHGALIASEEELRNYLPNVQVCHSVAWNRIQDKLLFSLCVVQNMKIS